ncbi:hypothetical protein BRC64_05705 [Halobacteriales archaeon QH_10_67_22]|nr:MAG: hypothetical protein BRC64_05705 [Halobacteriales archaeon QH_10_67_22]
MFTYLCPTVSATGPDDCEEYQHGDEGGADPEAGAGATGRRFQVTALLDVRIAARSTGRRLTKIYATGRGSGDMSRLGSRRGPVATLNDQVLRLVGTAFVLCSGVVALASVATDYGLGLTGEATTNAATDLGTAGLVVGFCLAHPAYPILAAVGLVLAALGDETPLLGS